jgi:hypothetical protein
LIVFVVELELISWSGGMGASRRRRQRRQRSWSRLVGAGGGACERNLLPRELCFLIFWNPGLGGHFVSALVPVGL